MDAVLTFVVGAIAAVLVTGAAAATARRLVGAPVGAVRLLLVGVVFFLAAVPSANALVVPAGLVDADTQEPLVGPGPVLLFLLLVFGWAFALAVAVLVLAELAAPTGTVRDPVTWLRDALARRRRTRRYLQVMGLFARRGLRSALRGDPRALSTAQRNTELVAAMEEAGVTFVKMGQVLSTRADVIPPSLAEELSRLQSHAATVPWSQIAQVIDAELGVRRADLDVDESPLAAASLAQVHAATLADGTAVVVKVQRPGAAVTVEVDTDIVRRIAHQAADRAQWARDARLGALADGFADALLEELDYRREASNTRMLAGAVGHELDVPAIHEAHSTRRVIVMQRVDGVTLDRAEAALAELTEEDRDGLAHALLRSVLRQILLTGVFHADLHPGNVVLQTSGRLALLDLGSVGILDAQLRENVLGLLLAIDAQDVESAATHLLQVVPPSDVDGYALRRDLGTAMTLLADGLTPTAMASLFGVIRDHRLALPPHVAAALRTFGSLTGCLQILAPRTEIMDLIRDCTRDLAPEVLAPKRLANLGLSRAAAGYAVASRVPGALDSLSRQVADGEVRAVTSLRHALQEWGNRVLSEIVSVAVAGIMVIAAVILLGVFGGPMMTATMPWTWFLASCLGLVGFALVLRVLFREFTRRSQPTTR